MSRTSIRDEASSAGDVLKIRFWQKNDCIIFLPETYFQHIT